jgi:hypothetical protein
VKAAIVNNTFKDLFVQDIIIDPLLQLVANNAYAIFDSNSFQNTTIDNLIYATTL